MSYHFETTREHLRAVRALAHQARAHVYIIDDGTVDGAFKCNLSHDSAGYYGMHPRVRDLLAALDEVMRLTAEMQDELDA